VQKGYILITSASTLCLKHAASLCNKTSAGWSYFKKTAMIILKSDYFTTHERLTLFINENKIRREDILSIVHQNGSILLFFYADDAIKEITHGLFG